MSEADIKILNDYLDENDRKLVSPKRFKFLQAIENLVNKYKEQEANLYASNQIINEYTESHKEQEKIIDLMAEYISGTDKDEDICKKFGENQFCNNYEESNKCKECVIEYYRKKAKGE